MPTSTNASRALCASHRMYRLSALMSAVAVLAACTDGTGLPATTTAAAPAPAAPVVANGSISGTAFKGPVAGATICVFKLDPAAATKKGAQLVAATGSGPTVAGSCVVTANDGSYTFLVPSGSTGDVVVESTGGTSCSDESTYNGSTCSGGGSPVALGSNTLRAVATAPDASKSVSAHPNVLTTAALANASTGTSASTYETEFGKLMAALGVSGVDSKTSPNSGSLNTLLKSIGAYVGTDAAALKDIIAAVSSGKLGTSTFTANATPTVTCAALDSNDLSQTYGFNTCVPDGTTGTYKQISQDMYSAAYGATQTGRRRYEQRNYADAACTTAATGGVTSVSDSNVSIALGTTTTLPFGPTADVTKSQKGTATQITFTFSPSVPFGNSTTTSVSYLMCRTMATPTSGCGNTFKAYLGSTAGPKVGGFFSKMDTTAQVSAYCD